MGSGKTKEQQNEGAKIAIKSNNERLWMLATKENVWRNADEEK